MYKFIGKMSAVVSMFVMALVASAGLVHAAADSDLTTALAAEQAMGTDNKGIILTFITGVGLVILIIAVAKGGLNWAIAKIAGAIGGRKRKK